jgi:hypothetical protein
MKRCRGTINKIISLKPSREWEVNFRRIEYLFTLFIRSKILRTLWAGSWFGFPLGKAPALLFACKHCKIIWNRSRRIIVVNLLRNRVVQSIPLLELLNHLNISSGYLLMTIYQLLIFLLKKRIGMHIKFETVTT